MKDKDLIQLYNQDQRIAVTYPDTRREETAHVVRHIGLGEGAPGTVLYADLTEANADTLIQEQINFFKQIGQEFEWKVFDFDQPANLQNRLAQHGFMVEEAEAIMVLPIIEAPDMLRQPIQADVRQVIDLTGLKDLKHIEDTVWQEDHQWLIDNLDNSLTHHPDQISIFIAYIDNNPASAAWIYYPPNSRFASLWGGSTLAEYRKQGLYTALLAHRLQEAATRHIDYLTVDASPMSQPILEKFGFQVLGMSYPCQWKG